jgi:hypothetical protein
MMAKSALSAPQKRLLETLQKTNFGRIEGLTIRAGEPTFDPMPRIVKDVKLGAPDNGARPEALAADFVLKREHIELFETLARVGDGVIECLEIKAGLPFRISMVEHSI